MKRLQEVEREFAVILDTLFENPHIGFVMLDREGMITHMNKNFMNIMGGLRKEDVIGKYVSWMWCLIPNCLKYWQPVGSTRPACGM
ncbi:MAG: PAS domain S-box protein [Syntrophomonadaceae bacterium]